jgi:hypothetical protein
MLFTLYRIIMKNQIRLFLLKSCSDVLEAKKHQICLVHLEDSPALPPPPSHLLYLQPSQRWANSDLAMTLDKCKYKYTNLAYNMAPQQSA